jgi:hypothetical protein
MKFRSPTKGASHVLFQLAKAASRHAKSMSSVEQQKVLTFLEKFQRVNGYIYAHSCR